MKLQCTVYLLQYLLQCTTIIHIIYNLREYKIRYIFIFTAKPTDIYIIQVCSLYKLNLI